MRGKVRHKGADADQEKKVKAGSGKRTNLLKEELDFQKRAWGSAGEKGVRHYWNK